MSFSTDVKQEIIHEICEKPCCAFAELNGMMMVAGSLSLRGMGRYGLSVNTESAGVARYIFTLSKKFLGVQPEIRAMKVSRLGMHSSYSLVYPEEKVGEILETLRLLDSRQAFGIRRGISHKIVGRDCCRRAFLRGAFLGGGSLSNPERGYHMEFVAQSQEQAEGIEKILNKYELGAKTVARKAQFVVYLKESEKIITLLTLLGAHQAVCALENVRIIKDMRNSVNRLVNFETANVSKTADAAARQVEAIEYLRDHVGLEHLSAGLRQMAEVRLNHKEATLAELGELMDPPMGKSGVNNRLRRLEAMALQRRGDEGQ